MPDPLETRDVFETLDMLVFIRFKSFRIILGPLFDYAELALDSKVAFLLFFFPAVVVSSCSDSSSSSSYSDSSSSSANELAMLLLIEL